MKSRRSLAGLILVCFALLATTTGCADEIETAGAGGAGMSEAQLLDTTIDNAAEVGLALLVAQGCDGFELDTAERDRRQLALAAEAARAYNFDPVALEASPLMRRVKKYDSDPELKRLIARKMAEVSVANAMHPDDPASMCRGGEAAVEAGTGFGPLLKRH